VSVASNHAARPGLGGALHLRPGAPLPHSVRSSRPLAVAHLAVGRPAAALPGLLASLFSACGAVHRLCATLALAAAAGQAHAHGAAARALLQRQTLRDHLQAVLLAWPAQLAGEAGDAGALSGCPLWQPLPPAAAGDDAAAAWARCRRATADWLAAAVFGVPLADWLAAWDADPTAALAAWCRQGRTATAQRLAALGPHADRLLPVVPLLRPNASAPALRAFAAGTAAAPAAPLWQGHVAETGVWTRLAEPAPQRLHSPRLRLGARLAELARLALPDDGQRSGADALAVAVLALAPGEGLACVEMARGLLLHRVRCVGDGDAATVAACTVLSPTDWNAHPAGGLAQALARLPAGEAGVAASAPLLAAYDPCVPCLIAPETSPDQPAHVAHPAQASEVPHA
jgi:hypothetical protein